MKTRTQVMLELWIESRTRFTKQLPSLTEEALGKRLTPSPNSAGFLIRHIGEVELLFAKNVFGAQDIKVSAKTVMDKRDTGEWTDLKALTEFVRQSFDSLKAIIENQTEADWETVVVTKEFGSKTKAEAFGRIISHTTYHAGQLAMVLLYGVNGKLP